MLRTLRARVAANSLDLARRGLPRSPFYLTGQVDGKGFSIHAAGERIIWTDATGHQREIDLVGPKDIKNPDTVPPSTPANQPAAAATTPPTGPLPEPICPDGSPRELPWEDPERPPGTSPLDDALNRLNKGLADPSVSGDHNPQRSDHPSTPDTSRDQGGEQ